MKSFFSPTIPDAAPDRVHIDFLTSGSGGNCTILRHGNHAVAIDIGLNKKILLNELSRAGITFLPGEPRLDAVFLTHLHADHIKASALSVLLDHNIQLFAHVDHMEPLQQSSSCFEEMRNAHLIRCYRSGAPVSFGDFEVLPVALPHDSPATHGFVFGFHDNAVRFGYAADLGLATDNIIKSLQNCDALGLEFNHDVDMQRHSDRPIELIDRVLGNYGHLSNEQAHDALCQIMYGSTERKLRHLNLLHRSRECNTRNLAEKAAARALNAHSGHKTEFRSAEQSTYSGTITFVSETFRG